MRKWVYTFGGGAAEGSRAEIEQLGGKGANLAEMAALGLPVPPGLTIVSDACGIYYKSGKTLPDDLKAQVLQGIEGIEAATRDTHRFATQHLGLRIPLAPAVHVRGGKVAE